MDLYGVKFLFDNQLIAALEKLIRDAKHELFLISPYIDLDNRIKDALREKINLKDFELKVLFGKNGQNHLKSINAESLVFLKQFPNIEIRHNERLHAKFYINDHHYLMTSLNLYNYSLANNIEIGLLGEYASKGIVGRFLESGVEKISEETNKLKDNIFGISKDEVDPLKKLDLIYNDSEVIYKTKPILVEETGIKGIFGGKKMTGFNVESETINDKPRYPAKNVKIEITESIKKFEVKTSSKKLSASQLAKSMRVSQNEITALMSKKGLIKDNKITDIGARKGLEMKTYMGNQYIAYPDDLEELKEY